MMPRLIFLPVNESPTPGPRPRLAPWLAIFGILALALVAFGAAQLLEDDDDEALPGPPPPGEVTPAPTTSPQLTLTDSVPDTTPGSREPPPGEPGALEVAGNDLYPSLGGSLLGFANQQVEGTAVPVVEVNGKSSLWVGQRGNRRLLVVLNLKGEPFPSVQPGDRVDLVGMILPNGDDYGVSDDTSKVLLERQGHHAYVSVFDLDVS